MKYEQLSPEARELFLWITSGHNGEAPGWTYPDRLATARREVAGIPSPSTRAVILQAWAHFARLGASDYEKRNADSERSSFTPAQILECAAYLNAYYVNEVREDLAAQEAKRGAEQWGRDVEAAAVALAKVQPDA